MIFFFLACLESENIEVWLRNEQPDVSIQIDSVSLRANGQNWYQDWHPLEITNESTILRTEYTLIASGFREHEEYHHVFVDAVSANSNGIEVRDVFEPIALDRSLTTRHHQIYLNSTILEAPGGVSIFLTDASVQ